MELVFSGLKVWFFLLNGSDSFPSWLDLVHSSFLYFNVTSGPIFIKQLKMYICITHYYWLFLLLPIFSLAKSRKLYLSFFMNMNPGIRMILTNFLSWSLSHFHRLLSFPSKLKSIKGYNLWCKKGIPRHIFDVSTAHWLDHLKWRLFQKKAGKLGNVITNNVIWTNQKMESFVHP